MIERKSFAFDIKATDDDQGIIEGYASIFGNTDSYGDIVDNGAFTKTLKENPDVPILWQHWSDEPIGVTVSAEENKRGLKVRGQLTLSVQKAREAYDLIKAGALKGLSIGFRTIKDEWDRENEVRHLKEVRLYEWSPVTFPANEKAGVTGVKSVRELHGILEIITRTDDIDRRGELDRDLLAKSINKLRALLDAEPETSTRSDEPPKTEDEPISIDHSIREVLRWAKELGVI